MQQNYVKQCRFTIKLCWTVFILKTVSMTQSDVFSRNSYIVYLNLYSQACLIMQVVMGLLFTFHTGNKNRA